MNTWYAKMLKFHIETILKTNTIPRLHTLSNVLYTHNGPLNGRICKYTTKKFYYKKTLKIINNNNNNNLNERSSQIALVHRHKL